MQFKNLATVNSTNLLFIHSYYQIRIFECRGLTMKSTMCLKYVLYQVI